VLCLLALSVRLIVNGMDEWVDGQVVKMMIVMMIVIVVAACRNIVSLCIIP